MHYKKSKEDLISVIIPTFNRKDFIWAAINSVLIQTYINYEIIVVDDGSTDNTSEIIRNYKDNKLKYFKIPHSGISAKVRNYGISQAEGKYIAFLDSDDIWMPKKLEKQISIGIANSGFNPLVTTLLILAWISTGFSSRKRNSEEGSSRSLSTFLLKINFLRTPSKYFLYPGFPMHFNIWLAHGILERSSYQWNQK